MSFTGKYPFLKAANACQLGRLWPVEHVEMAVKVDPKKVDVWECGFYNEALSLGSLEKACFLAGISNAGIAIWIEFAFFI